MLCSERMKHDQIEPPENLDQLDKHETAIESAANDPG